MSILSHFPNSELKVLPNKSKECLKPQFKAWKLTDWSLVMLLKLVNSKVHSRVKSPVAELSNRSLGSNVLDKYASWQLEPLSKGRQWRIWHNKTQHMLWTIFSPWMLMEDSPFFTSSVRCWRAKKVPAKNITNEQKGSIVTCTAVEMILMKMMRMWGSSRSSSWS